MRPVPARLETSGEPDDRAARLEQLATLHRELLLGLGHNLRAPLARIELAADDLAAVTSDPVVTSRVQAIRDDAWRLARLVDQVLLSARLETGDEAGFDEEPVALAPLVRRTAAQLAISDRVAVSDLAPGLVAVANRAATEQIAWILLDNAARYAPSGPIRAEVSVAGSAAEPAILLAIEDEGPGVPPAERRRVFQRFVHGSAPGAGEGAGLGLSIARGLARSLGGDVTYRAGAVGARFEVRLPAGGGEGGGGGA
jgi:signal transduction histidine kinase